MAIEFKNVSFKYNDFDKNNIIHNMNIELDDNKIYGLIGKSGSGKTTILELIDGLIKPTSGKILVDYIDTTKKEIRKKGNLNDSLLIKLIYVRSLSRYDELIYIHHKMGI